MIRSFYFIFCLWYLIAAKPNILIFIVDDLGVGDVGCFGNSTINTPNIDKLCLSGVKFNHSLAAASLCTPSRSALLTGRYAIRDGMVPRTENTAPVFIHTSASGGLPKNSITFGHILKERNYTNGYFGKWHLGVHCEEKDFCHFPLSHGFDYFFGLPLTNLLDCDSKYLKESEVNKKSFLLPPNRYIIEFSICGIFTVFLLPRSVLRLLLTVFLSMYVIFWAWHIIGILIYQQLNCILMRNYDVVQQPVQLENLTLSLTSEVKNFITRYQHQTFMAVVAYHNVHVALASSPNFKGKSKHGKYGDNVEEVDWSIGEILKALDELNLSNNTFIYFTSDHGPALYMTVDGEYHGGSKGILKGGKGSCWEGGIRVPTIIKWSGVLPSGLVYEMPTSGLDLFPTVVALSGASPLDSIIDGENIVSLLTDQHERFLFHYCNAILHAVTYSSPSLSYTKSRIWKLHFITQKWVNGTENSVGNRLSCDGDIHIEPLLYELEVDPSESQPVNNLTIIYKIIVGTIYDAVKSHQETLHPVEDQLSVVKNTFSFKRQMCCNKPYCYC